jgi:ATP-dependent 26S proteasome regulatory subunit
MPDATIQHVLQILGQPQATPQLQAEIQAMLLLAATRPTQLVGEHLKLRDRAVSAEANCTAASQAAADLNNLIQEMLSSHRQMARLEMVRDTPSGLRALCMMHGAYHELAIHPDVDAEGLLSLKPWEYVAVAEHVVVGSWHDDPWLLESAQGDVVEFKGYLNGARTLARVMRHGHDETVVMLAEELRERELTPRDRLVLQRDDPRRAIAVVAAEHSQSRFEVPIDGIRVTLEDLAGVEDIAERLLEDILLRIYHPNIRDRFGLEPLKGILLYSRPGMGKTVFVSAVTRWLFDRRDQLGFDVSLYVIKPNEAKSMWHGEDSRIIREDLWGAIRARQSLPRDRPLVQVVVIDEADSLGRRAGAGEAIVSSAQSDALESMLVEMDGMFKSESTQGPPAYVLCAAMTNRLDRIDEALRRPGRFDLVIPMPEVDAPAAEGVMAIYARGQQLPWQLAGAVRQEVSESEIRAHVLRPAVARIFPAVVARYKTDTQRRVDVTAGEILANVHYKEAMQRARRRAALRHLTNTGVPAVSFDDVIDSLVDVAVELAAQMETDPGMLVRQLQVKVPVVAVEAVPKDELMSHRFLQVVSASA